MARYRKTEDGWERTSGSVQVIDNLESTSTTSALSANQGRELMQDLTHNYYTKTEVDAKVPKWGTMQELGDITTSTQITATKNGFLKVFINPSTINGAQARFAVAGSSYSVITLNGEGCYAVAPCNAGDVITCSILTGASNIRIYQIPFI